MITISLTIQLVECTAEQVYSEGLIAYAILTVGVDQTVMGFIKGALRMRSGFKGIKFCEKILTERKNWQSDVLKREFECGIIGCLGVFDMVISFFPRRFITLLHLAGFTGITQGRDESSSIRRLLASLSTVNNLQLGDRMNGLARLDRAASVAAIRSLPAMAAVAGYHIGGEFCYGLGKLILIVIIDSTYFVHN